jgi:hypothetical protein
VQEGAQHGAVHAVVPAGAVDLVGPAGAAQLVAEVVENGGLKVDLEGLGRSLQELSPLSG